MRALNPVWASVWGVRHPWFHGSGLSLKSEHWKVQDFKIVDTFQGPFAAFSCDKGCHVTKWSQCAAPDSSSFEKADNPSIKILPW